MKLSVIVPAYNESTTILEIIRRVRSVDIGMEKEIIVLDGNSTDGTRELLKQEEGKPDIRVIYETQREGKGAAVHKGFKLATGELIIVQDADLELDPSEYPKLIKPILDGQSDVVYGSRFINGHKNVRFLNYLANFIVTQSINFLFGSNLTDSQTGYKIFKSELLNDLPLTQNGFMFDTEITLLFIRQKKNIMEVPVCYAPRTIQEGKKLQWREGFRVFYNIYKYKLLKRM